MYICGQFTVIEIWCNGSTTDFGSVCPGSNPGISTKFHPPSEAKIWFCLPVFADLSPPSFVRSEWNIYKWLTINYLRKYNSLQTFVFWTAKEIWFYLPNFSWFYLQVFHPMSICHICNALIISTLPKTPLLLGTSESTQAQAWFFINHLLSAFYKNTGWLWGESCCLSRPEKLPCPVLKKVYLGIYETIFSD